MKKLITSVYFYIGVNVIGIPELIEHDLLKTVTNKSVYHR